MWRGLRQLHKLFAIFKRLAQFLHPGFHPVHPVDALYLEGGIEEEEI